jgi:hypothetical protein
MGMRKWRENLAGEMAGEKGRERKGGKFWRERNRGKNLAGEKGQERKSGKVWREIGLGKEKTVLGYANGGPRHRTWL